VNQLNLNDITDDGVVVWQRPLWLGRPPGVVGQLLDELQRRRIWLKVYHDRIRLRPSPRLPADLRERLRDHKADIICLLAPAPRPEEIRLCVEWLRRFGVPTRTLRPEHSSYALKHFVEQWSDQYVTNGAFIAAALIEGYQAKADFDGSLNAVFNLSIRKWESAREQPGVVANPLRF